MADRGAAPVEERRSRDGRGRAAPEEKPGGPGPVPALAAEPAPRGGRRLDDSRAPAGEKTLDDARGGTRVMRLDRTG